MQLSKKDQYLWLGSNFKYIKLKPKETKQVSFKICFFNRGVYEICNKKSKSTIESNSITNSTSTLNTINTNISTTNNTNLYEEYNQEKLNDSNCICIYLNCNLNNDLNSQYILYKELNSSLIIIS